MGRTAALICYEVDAVQARRDCEMNRGGGGGELSRCSEGRLLIVKLLIEGCGMGLM